MVVSALLHLGFVPMWTLWRAGASLRQEWSSNHMSLLLTLPVPGWYITSAKALVLLAEMLWYIVLVLAGTLVLAIEGSWIQRIDLLGQAYVIGGEIYSRIPAEALSWRTLLFALGVVTAVAASGIIATQFSYIAGCLWRRWSGLFSTAVAGLSVWFILRAGTLLAPLFRWVPEIPVDGAVIVNNVRVQQTMYLGLSPVFGALAAVALLFWLGYVEITGDDVDEIRVELELYAFTNGDPEEARRILEAYDIVLLPGRTTVQLSARQPEEPVPFDGIHHAVWRIVVPREMAVEVRTTPAVVNIAGVRGGIRAEGVGAQLFLQPAGAAAIDVSLALGGLLDIAMPEEAANHSLHAVLNPGSLFVDAPGFESIRAGARETLTGAIGEGAHPLRIELIDSSGFVRIGK